MRSCLRRLAAFSTFISVAILLSSTMVIFLSWLRSIRTRSRPSSVSVPEDSWEASSSYMASRSSSLGPAPMNPPWDPVPGGGGGWGGPLKCLLGL